MGILFNENAISSGNYIIGNSLRFQSASSQYLSRTPAGAPTSNKIMTLSAWVKRGALGSPQQSLMSSPNTGNADNFRFSTSDTLSMDFQDGVAGQLTTTQVFRDPSAWYHIVLAIDTTQATNTNRVKLYVNGSQVTSFGTASYPAQNTVVTLSSANATYLGRYGNAAQNYLDGYMAEINFIDGQALTPSSFGTTDPTSGQWVAAKYTGTYGTNGFYLPFSNGTSTTTLGADSSGNGNNWTLTNFTRSAGVSDCWMVDVPSGNSSTGGNYPVINPLWANSGAGMTLKSANLQTNNTSASTYPLGASIAFPSSGKWYAEFTVVSNDGTFPMFGIVDLQTSPYTNQNIASVQGVSYRMTGIVQKDNVNVSSSAPAFTNNDVIGVAFDASTNNIWFSKNGTWILSGDPANNLNPTTTASAPTKGYVFGLSTYTSAQAAFNGGSRSFAYTPPSGFKALCTANLPVATIKQGNKYMDATTYSGNGTSQTITNAGGFKPDLVWIKSRSTTYNNNLQDSVRGAGKSLLSNLTNAEFGNSGDLLTSFNSNGFTVNNTLLGGSDPTTDGSGQTFVGWQWQAGQGTTSSNTSGSITSTVSVNATAGFSVVTYTGNGSTSTVGHGLGVTPKMIIVKNRGDGGANWAVYHVSTGANAVLFLNSTAATTTVSGKWGTPNSTTFGVNTAADVNESGFNLVAYCFAEIAGFSKFGSYTANASTDGPFVYCGFRPKFIMIKGSVAGNNWVILDTSRNTYNVSNFPLLPNLSNAESANADGIDILSNGFKVRVAGDDVNFSSGATYIFAAFAESPFQNSNAR